MDGLQRDGDEFTVAGAVELDRQAKAVWIVPSAAHGVLLATGRRYVSLDPFARRDDVRSCADRARESAVP
jgi:hypothetical protein